MNFFSFFRGGTGKGGAMQKEMIISPHGSLSRNERYNLRMLFFFFPEANDIFSEIKNRGFKTMKILKKKSKSRSDKGEEIVPCSHVFKKTDAQNRIFYFMVSRKAGARMRPFAGIR